MGEFNVEGMDELSTAFVRQEAGATAAVEEMLTAAADIYLQEQKKAAESYGIRRTGGFIDSIKKGKVVKTSTEMFIEIQPEGTASHKADYGGGGKKRKGKSQGGNVRYMTIGYIMEYGTSSMTARPWHTLGNTKAEEKAHSKVKEIWDKYIDNSFS